MSKRITIREASRLTGHPTRCLLTQFVRLGLLPYPCQKTATWAKDDIDRLMIYLDERRRRSDQSM